MIRNMNEDDNEKVFKLGLTLFREEDEIPYFKKAIETYIKDLSYVVIDSEAIIGFILVCKKITKIYKDFIKNIPNCYELSFFGIDPKYQGKGYGSQCLRLTLSSIYKSCNKFNCWLIVDQNNYSAIKMYRKYGFRIWCSIDNNDIIPSYIMGLSHKRCLMKIT
jgi:ribosomal protein S18 acetylase RimI-like enzyme